MEKLPLKYNNRKPPALEIEFIKITKAAIRQGEFVYTGWRHASIMAELRELGFGYINQDDQGFIDQDGHFYRRVAADTIVRITKQATIAGSILLSEDLWDHDGSAKLP